MSVLVTGSTGLLGNNIVRLLLEQGRSVKVLVRGRQEPDPLAGLDVERVVGDLDQEATLRRAMEGVSLVFHSAGFVKIGWREIDVARRINVEGSRRLARIARSASTRFVHVSTVDTLALGKKHVPASETTPATKYVPCSYVLSKREADQAIREECRQGLDGVIVHPGFMLGPWDWKPSSGKMLLEVTTIKPPVAPPGGCSVVDVRHVAKGVLAAARVGKVGESYILAGENVSYFDLWRMMARQAKTREPRTLLRQPFRSLVGWSTDAWTWVRGKEGDLNGAAVQMGAQYHYYSSQKAIEELGYSYGSAADAVAAAWEWFKSQGRVKA